MKKIDAVLFDLDGTLVDSKIDYEKMARVVRDILVLEGIPFTDLDDRGKVYRFILNGESIFEKYDIDPNRIDNIQILMTEAMNRVELEAVNQVEKMPNAEVTLNAIKQRGLKIGIATRGGNDYAKMSLRLTGMNKYIDVLLPRDRVERPKPDPMHLLHVIKMLETSKDNVIYIGDTPTDFKASIAAGVIFYGYKRNENWLKRLIEAGCDNILEDLLDVVDIIDQVNSKTV